jgi:NTP pyrophosphatase (non-canonical NTP hydrolase)
MSFNFKSYQDAARATRMEMTVGNLTYSTLGLVGEAGEVANKIKKIERGEGREALLEAVKGEMGDVLWYLAAMADDLGVDLAAPKGTPVLSAQNGMVIYAGRDFRGYGRMVLVESGNGIATLYAHFDRIYVTEGQRVHSGEILGAMGRSGRATGVHLHFEVRKDKGPIDPLPLLPGGTRIAKLIQ